MSVCPAVCPVNRCADQTLTCHIRNVPGQPEFICECDRPFRVGLNCMDPFDDRQIFTCYGANCTTGVFASPNYPNAYMASNTIVYLIYVPGAAELVFEFDSPFGIEVPKDEVYIGSGVTPNLDDLVGVSRVPDLYFFDGREVPSGSYSIFSDTAFVYFLSDKNIEYEGFQVRWRTVDNVAPVITCPADRLEPVTTGSENGAVISWSPATATDDTSTPTVILTSGRGPGSFFEFGAYTISYVATDLNGNSASCSFSLSVVDRVAPVVTCPANINQQFGINQNRVTWQTPSGSDNSQQTPTIAQTSGPTSGSTFTPGTTTTIVYTATDAAGNIGTCSFTVQITGDTIPPSIFCPTVPDEEVRTGNSAGATVNWNLPNGFDNFGTPTVALFPSTQSGPGSFFVFGTYAITYRATDAAGNTADCDVTFSVVDRVAPVVTCPANINQQFGINQNRVTWQTPSGSDNSQQTPTIAQTSGPTSGSTFTPGTTTTIVYTATDAAGNIGTCSFTVQITGDTIPPSIFCPTVPDEEVRTGNSAGATVNWNLPNGFDNFGTPTVALFPSTQSGPGSFFVFGSYAITYRATDAAGNTADCDVTFSVVDRVAPVVTCPANINQQFGTNQNRVTWQTPSGSDNSQQTPTIAQTSGPTSGSTFTPGTTTTIVYTATDAAGNIGTCSFTVQITGDTIPPSIFCPTVPDEEVRTGNSAGATVNWNLPNGFDNFGTPTVALFPTTQSGPGSFFVFGTYAITYRATDGAGNTADCDVTFSVVDRVAPVVTCPANINQQFGTNQNRVTWQTPSGSDNSQQTPTIAQTSGPTSGSTFTPGTTTTIVYTATDAAGNIGTCSFTVQITGDTIPPSIFCPTVPDEEVRTGNSAGATVNWNLPNGFDNFGTPTVALFPTTQSGPGSFFAFGTYAITYRATDGAGNTADCDVTFSVVDRVAPVVTCPANVNQQFGINQNRVTWQTPSGSDNSQQTPTIAQTSGPTSGSTFTPGTTTTIVYTATDAAGNIGTCSFTVQITGDTIPPSIFCPTVPDEEVRTGNSAGATVNWNLPNGFDNFGTPTVALFPTTQSGPGSFFAFGTYAITYRATDGAGNTADCDVTFSVVDRVAPVVTCPANINQQFGTNQNRVTWQTPSGSDNSQQTPTIAQTSGPTSGSTFTPGATTTIVYTATDAAGNIGTCSFTVQITGDTIPPSIFCPTVQDVTVSTGNNAGTTVTWATPQVSDNSDIAPTVALFPPTQSGPGSFFVFGTYAISYRATDAAGNVGDCDVNFSVVDGVPPQFTFCPDNILQQFEADNGVTTGLNVNWLAPEVSDNSGQSVQAVLVEGSQPGSFFNIGQTTITYSATDAAGNFNMCTFTVTVVQVDGTPPQFDNCPQDILRTIPIGSTSIPITWPTITVTDNSGNQINPVLLSQNPGQFTEGTFRIRYQATDQAGNSAICSFDVIVTRAVDTTPPVVQNCPSNINQEIPIGITSTTVTWQQPFATDNSGQTPAVTSSHTSGSTFFVGSTTVTYTFTDQSSNSATCQFAVTVTAVDRTPPQFDNCPQDIRRTIPIGSTSIPITWPTITVTDNSGNQINPVLLSQNPGQFNEGTYNIRYQATDQAGNSAICSFDVIVTRDVDTTPPVVQNCPSNINQEIPFGSTSTTVTWQQPFATDNSGQTPAVTSSHTSGSTFFVGSTTVTYTFTDQSSNFATCQFVVTVTAVDRTPPQFDNCPQDIRRTIPIGSTSIPITWPTITVTDNSGNQINPVLLSQNPGQFNEGTYNIRYQATDQAGNSAICSFDVIVTRDVDTTPPVVQNCPSNINQEIPFGSTSTTVTWQQPFATDNSGQTPAVTSSHTSGSTFFVGSTTVTYTFTDQSSNFATCQFVVTVTAVDRTPPQFDNCPQDIRRTIPIGSTSIPITWPTITVTDNSGNQINPVLLSQNPGQFNEGTYNIRYQATDQAGNSAICSFDVIVTRDVDTTPPVIQNCPSNINQEIPFGSTSTTVTWQQPFATDNSGQTPAVTSSHTSGSPFFVGSTTVTYTFTDQSSNFDTCQFVVTVTAVDRTPPQFDNCPQDIRRTIPFGSTSIPITWPTITVTDNSGNQINPVLLSQNPGQFNEGTYNIRYQATDQAGNSAICSFDVIVTRDVDTTPPVVQNCPSNFNQEIPFGSTSTTVTWQQPFATDNSGQTPAVTSSHTSGSTFFVGSTTVTYTFTDQSSNFATCQFVVTVTAVDRTPPQFDNCPQDIRRTIPFGSTSIPITWPTITVTDNSGNQINPVLLSQNPGQFNEGTYNIRYQATDQAGNSAICSFDVIVTRDVDTTPPVVQNCPSNFNQEIPFGSTSTTVTWQQPFATDNSGQTPAVTSSHTSGSTFFVGSTTVTYTFTDQSSNFATCQFVVTVTAVDRTPPQFDNCPQDIRRTIPFGSTSIPITWPTITVTDNSGNQINPVLLSQNPGQFNEGTYNIRYQATDQAGNSAICSFDVIVTRDVDTTPPVVQNCPSNFNQEIPFGSTSTTVTWQQPFATDNSGQTPAVTSSHTSGSTFFVGSTAVTYTFTDQSSNFATCQFVVTVTAVDRTPPQFDNCPQDIRRTIPFGSTSIPITWPTITVTDNSGNQINPVLLSQNPGQFNEGTYNIRYQATDQAGNSAICSFDVIVTRDVDTTPPVVQNCPSNFNQEIPFGSTSTTVTWQQPFATDNSGQTPAVTSSHTSGSTFFVGSTAVTYTFTDQSSNFATCQFVVTVTAVDRTPPQFDNCPQDIRRTIPFGSTSIPITWPTITVTDNSGNQINPVLLSQNPGQFNEGTYNIRYQATDQAGNSAICSFDVIVTRDVDTTPPVIQNCPSNINQEIPFGSTSTTVTWQQPFATDNSGQTPAVTSSHTSGSTFFVGSTAVTYTFTDQSSNFATCQFAVTLTAVDTTPPVVQNCPSNINQEIPIGSTSTTVTWQQPFATDNSGQTPAVTSSHTSGSTFFVGSTTVTYTFTDQSSNFATCQFAVTLTAVDTTPPVVQNCPSNINQEIPIGSTSTTVTWQQPFATDNSGQTPAVTSSHTSGSTFFVGSTTVTYTFTDQSSNFATCQFAVTVTAVDRTPPQFDNCPQDILRTIPIGSTSIQITWPTITATDNSGNQINPVPLSQNPGQFTEGPYNIRYQATDQAGNSAICSFNIIVTRAVDTTPPVVQNCPSNFNQEIPIGSTSTTVTWQQPFATDNSGPTPTVTSSHTSGSTFFVGSTTVTYTFTDQSGNFATCQFVVTVTAVDRTPPQFDNCPQDIRRTIPIGSTSIPITWPTITVTDNSGNQINPVLLSQNPGQFNEGTYNIRYQATDQAGNSAICSFDVIVTRAVDTTPPVVQNCPSNFNQEIPIGITSTTVTWQQPFATDNSGQTPTVTSSHTSGSTFFVGSTTVTYTFTDQSSNFATCQFVVTVTAVDRTPPQFDNCPQDIRRTIPFGSTSIPITWPTITVTDNSGNQINPVLLSQNPGQFNEGTYNIRYRATDQAGNSAICSFDVIVTRDVDTTPPVVQNCPSNINQEIPIGSTSTTVTWQQPFATDNSGQTPTVTSSHTSGSTFFVGSTTVTYTFTDQSSNFATCQFVVTVTAVDRTPPEVVFCPSDITRTILRGTGPVIVTWQEPSANDNSGNMPTMSSSHNSGDSFSASTSVTYTFTDADGNSALCTFTISITEVNPCDTQQCQNGGVCVASTLQAIRCVCPICFSGDRCQIAADACQSNTCQNGAGCLAVQGSCTAYVCQCTQCFTGTFCTEAASSCVNHQCNNGGVCTVSPNNCQQYTCICPSCFEGQYCQTAINPCQNHNCQNGGQCRPVVSSSAFSCTEYVCECSPCFMGEFCIQPRNACQPNPCSNGGLCSTLPDSCFSYSCQCSGCFTGYNCEVAVASPCQTNPCLNGGQCMVVTGICTTYTCQCPSTHNGVHCGLLVIVSSNACTSSPCLNGGNCLTMDGSYYICLCTTEYVGQNCQYLRANTPAAVNACATSPCANGAICINSYNSNSNAIFGTSQTYSCICTNGFTGVNCGSRSVTLPLLGICELGTKPACQRGASCSNMYHNFDQDVDYICNCPNGWTGHNCELQERDVCFSGPCQNGGQCQIGQNSFSCTCPSGFTGLRCENAQVDTQSPVINGCPNDISQTTSNPNGQSVFWTPPTATDNAGVPTILFQSHSPGAQFPATTSLVTYIFVDNSLNFASCQFYVTLTAVSFDNTAPVISGCPFGQTVTAPSGSTSAIVTWNEPTASDNSGQPPQLKRSHAPGTTFSLGYTAVTYEFRDATGNQATCTFLIYVVGAGITDTIPPTVSGCTAAATTVTAGVSQTSAQVFWNEPTATDNSGQQVSLTRTHRPGDTFSLGQTTVTYTFTDNAGNRAICSFSITVQSQGSTGVVVSNCPSQGVTVTAPQGAAQSSVTWQEPTATDGFGQAVTNVIRSHVPGQLFAIGQTQVTYQFVSTSGSQGLCSFTVTVNAGFPVDNQAPTFTVPCPNGVTVNAPIGSTTFVVSWTPPQAIDNSGTVNTIASHEPGSTFIVGAPTSVTYRFTDPSGNFVTCTFTVLVSVGSPDNTPPTYTNCPSDITVSPATGATTATASWQEPVGQDNSGVAPQVFRSHAPGSVFGLGSTAVSYRFVDGSGNEATCSFFVTVVVSGGDNINPVLTGCPTGVTAYVPAAVTSVRVTWTAPTATDNSGVTPTVTSTPAVNTLFMLGTTVVIYTATDTAGNQAVCQFAVNVIVDIMSPVVIGCPATIRGTLPAGQSSIPLTWSEPTATDNSQLPVTLNRTHVPGEAFGSGTTDVIYTFSDSVGNQAMCTFMVTVSADAGNNPCASNPCPAGMSCFYTSDAYLCMIRSGRKRRDAMTDEAEYCPCENGGECAHVDTEPPSYFCICPVGFQGVLCEEAVSDECDPNPCANNGTCVVTVGSDPLAQDHYACLCSDGWTGPNCRIAMEDELVTHTSDLDVMHHQPALLDTEWFMAALTAMVVSLFLMSLIAVFCVARRQVLPASKADDEIAIIR
ncbi:uncharacterized protein LOC119736577 [Patiria miniata]|uniref:Hyalin n=1 Tax=Patiria miniata TaxID=46514 RepID=A0A914AT44_PATMI|nr:uncharacterized protein LOC119736577 [Patiria miniata]